MASLADCLGEAVKAGLLSEDEKTFVAQKAAAQTGMTRKEAKLWAAKACCAMRLELDSMARQLGKAPGPAKRQSKIVFKSKDKDAALAAMMEETQIVADLHE